MTVSEQCEDHDGGPTSGDGCSDTCQLEADFTCTTQLDFPSAPTDLTTCSGVCGNLKKTADEVCDDGDMTDGRGCKPDCTGPLPGWVCIGGNLTDPSVCSPVCGDDILISPEEECEDHDGGPTSLDGCSSVCKVETGFTCTTNFDFPTAPTDLTVCTPICGDGKVMAGEVCDDGTETDLAGCNADCTGNEAGWICTGGSTTSRSECITVCGDSILLGTE